jgi:hypothetical protein
VQTLEHLVAVAGQMPMPCLGSFVHFAAFDVPGQAAYFLDVRLPGFRGVEGGGAQLDPSR